MIAFFGGGIDSNFNCNGICLKKKIKNELKYKDANMEDQKNKYRQATY